MSALALDMRVDAPAHVGKFHRLDLPPADDLGAALALGGGCFQGLQTGRSSWGNAMCWHTVFDYSPKGELSFVIPVAMPAAAIAWGVFKLSTMEKDAVQTSPRRWFDAVGLVCIGVLGVLLISGIIAYREVLSLRYHKGWGVQVVAGPVKTQAENDEATEYRLSVNDHSFSYSNHNAAYNRDMCKDFGICAGSVVRLSYIGGEIVKIEAPEPRCSGAPPAKS